MIFQISPAAPSVRDYLVSIGDGPIVNGQSPKWKIPNRRMAKFRKLTTLILARLFWLFLAPDRSYDMRHMSHIEQVRTANKSECG